MADSDSNMSTSMSSGCTANPDTDTATLNNINTEAPCSICHEIPEEGKRATVPGCGHSFCAGCIVSWAAVRGACALCRAPFELLLVSRTLNGELRNEPALEPVTLLRRVSWIETVSFEPDLDVFAPPPADIPSTPDLMPTTSARAALALNTRSTAPYYQDERIEDELEDLFWAEEEKAYRELSRRTVGNRPFGANGFLASGRRSARPVQVTRRQRAAAAAASSTAGSSASHANSSQAPTRRKKKVKKNSRAGKEAAAAAAAAAAAVASNANQQPSTTTTTTPTASASTTAVVS